MQKPVSPEFNDLQSLPIKIPRNIMFYGVFILTETEKQTN